MLRNASLLSLVIGILSLGITATPFGKRDTNTPTLNTRQNLCCALSVDNRFIQPVCQFMLETCGGWKGCLTGQNDYQNWCFYCVAKHPEDKAACLERTWPPRGPAPVSKRGLDDDATISPLKDGLAPVGKRGLDDATISPPKELTSLKDNTKD